MKHGRRHDSLKEKAYLERQNAEGYKRPYRPIDVAMPQKPPVPPPPAEVPLGTALSKRDKRALKRVGIAAEDES